MFEQLGDDSCKGNRSIVPSITYVSILVFTKRYNDILHAFFHALNKHIE